jgi:hypothetical protein
MKKHKFTHTHVEHHKDGSHTVHHVHEDGPHMDVKGAAKDHDEMMDHIMDHTSEPNPGEELDEAGKALPGAAAPAAAQPQGA